MLRITLLALGTASLLATSTAQADGFFRRLPQPGEYTVYDTLLFVTTEDVDTLGNIPEFEGTLTLKCVGIEEIEGDNHYWIEIDMGIDDATPNLRFTLKLLVAEPELLDGDPVENFVRGWYDIPESMDPLPLELRHVNSTTDQMPLWIRAIFRGIEEEPETLEQSQTVEFGERSLTIPTAEHGDFADDVLNDDSNGRLSLSGWGTWWLHDDAEFGVAAAEQLWSIESESVGTLDFAIQCTLKEFGHDAVSALPEHD